MKKINNKGFMMAELVIVSAVIVTTLTLLYATYANMYIVYQERSSYYNIDASYAAKNIYNYLLDNNKFIASINKQLMTNGNCISDINTNFCVSLKNTYNLNNAYLVQYNSIVISNLSGTKIQEDYFEFLSTSLDFNNYSYIIIVELKSNENFYYGYYRVR